jgi:hypothetical protein
MECAVDLESISSVPVASRVNKAVTSASAKPESSLLRASNVAGDELVVGEEQANSDHGQDQVYASAETGRLLQSGLQSRD